MPSIEVFINMTALLILPVGHLKLTIEMKLNELPTMKYVNFYGHYGMPFI